MVIVSRILHVQLGLRLIVTNKFKYQRRLSSLQSSYYCHVSWDTLSSRLATVMLRGTPSPGGISLINRLCDLHDNVRHFCAERSDKIGIRICEAFLKVYRLGSGLNIIWFWRVSSFKHLDI